MAILRHKNGFDEEFLFLSLTAIGSAIGRNWTDTWFSGRHFSLVPTSRDRPTIRDFQRFFSRNCLETGTSGAFVPGLK
jgi:hypothetical protein